MKEYLQEREEMEERVKKRPLLLERTAQVIDLVFTFLPHAYPYTGVPGFLLPDIQELLLK